MRECEKELLGRIKMVASRFQQALVRSTLYPPFGPLRDFNYFLFSAFLWVAKGEMYGENEIRRRG